MKTLFVIAALAAAPVSRADAFVDALAEAMSAAEQGALQGAAAARAAEQKPDVFSLDLAKAPAYIKEAIAAAEAGKKDGWGRPVAKSKAELRLEIAQLQNAVESAFEKTKLGCQGRLEAAIAQHAKAQVQAAADMKDIHAAVVKLRDELAASIASGKGQKDSVGDKLAADHAAIAALRRYGRAVDDVVNAATESAERELRRASSTGIELADAQIEALAKSKGLAASRYQREAKLELEVTLAEKEPDLRVCAPAFEGNGAFYRSCAKVGLATGAKAGDALVESLSLRGHGGDSSQIVTQPASTYVPGAVSECVALEAAQRAFAKLP